MDTERHGSSTANYRASRFKPNQPFEYAQMQNVCPGEGLPTDASIRQVPQITEPLRTPTWEPQQENRNTHTPLFRMQLCTFNRDSGSAMQVTTVFSHKRGQDR